MINDNWLKCTTSATPSGSGMNGNIKNNPNNTSI